MSAANTNNIETLREHLFDTLKGLKDKTIDVEQAKAIVAVGGTIIDSAKVEVEFLRVAGATKGTGFVQLPEKSTPAQAARQLASGPVVEPNGGRSYLAGRPKGSTSK